MLERRRVTPCWLRMHMATRGAELLSQNLTLEKCPRERYSKFKRLIAMHYRALTCFSTDRFSYCRSSQFALSFPQHGKAALVHLLKSY